MIAQHHSYMTRLFLLALCAGVSALGTQTLVASEPPEYISEVIPIKHARASNVAAALLKMTVNGVGTATANTGNSTSQSPIIFDERSNSLLIYATSQDMQKIKALVSELDVVGTQVLIEAVIFDLSLDDSEGPSVSALDRQDQASDVYPASASVIGGNNLLSLTPFASHATTNAPASHDSAFNYLARLGNDLDAMMPVLASDSRVRILQRPRIQTSDGEPATLFIGESRPYPTSTYYSGGAYGGYSSIQQLKISLTLEVTPRIKPDRLIELDIHQTNYQVSGIANIAYVSDVAITTSSEGQVKVIMRDHETIMLGGLINTVTNRVSSGVPLLKSIPLLGSVFRSSSTRITREEIVTLIRPTILPATNAVAALNRQTGYSLNKGN